MNLHSKEQDETDRRIGDTMSRLAGAEPSPGFQGRLLDALRVQSTALAGADAERTGWPLRRLGRRPTWFARARLVGLGAALAGCCLLALVMVLRRPEGGVARVSRAEVGRGSPEGIHPDSQRAEAQGTLPSPSPAPAGEAQRPAERAAGTRVSAQERVRGSAAMATPYADTDQAAVDDLHTASFPAPPLPPTAQERLVRLMLRRGEKHDLAQLDPVSNAVFAAQEQMALREFFEPPRPPGEAQPAISQPATSQPATSQGEAH